MKTPYQLMPALTPDEYKALKADIALRGVQVPIEYDEKGQILDGHHRLRICSELGIKHWPRIVRSGFTEPEKRQHVRRLNLDRRHLNTAQRRELIEQELLESPEKSDRSVAVALGVSHKTVGTVRGRIEASGTALLVERRVGRDGKRRLVKSVVSGLHKPSRKSAQDFSVPGGDIRRWSVPQVRRFSRILSSVMKHCGAAEDAQSIRDLISDAQLKRIFSEAN